MKKVPITICIVARNEEQVIEECLQNVYGWADEILVVDSSSSDNTGKLAKKYAKVFVKVNDPSHHVNKLWCFRQARNEWVLSLDSDEKLSDGLKKEIELVVSENKKVFDAYDMPRRQILHGRPLKYDWIGVQRRLYRKDKVFFEGKKLHEYIQVKGRVGLLKNPLIHFGWWRGIHAYVYKMNNYTTFDAARMVRDGEKYTFFTLIKKCVSQLVQLLKSRIIFNRFPYGLFFLIADWFNEFLLFTKVNEFEITKQKDAEKVVNKYV